MPKAKNNSAQSAYLTLWKHSSQTVLFVVLVVLALFTSVSGLVFITRGRAHAATSSTINFQARLLGASGNVVDDGTYNIQFNLYTVASGGSSEWTESYLNNASQGVQVKNGFLSVSLGSLTGFPSTINWDQEHWLGMTVRGTGSCAFGSCTPGDSEMTPRFKLTAVPYAFQAGTALGVTSNATSAASTNSGNVNITTGNASGATSNSGSITIDSGTATGTTGALLLGTANASALTIGRAGITTALQGSISLTGAGTALSVTNDASIGGTLAVTGTSTFTGTLSANGGLTVANGKTFTNAGSTLNTSVAISNLATGGAIGTAAATVDGATTFDVNQTTTGQTLTLPNPTVTTSGRIVYVNNVGSASFSMYGSVLGAGKSNAFIWNGTAWVTSVSLSGTVVNTVGTIDSQTKSSDGAVIASNAIYLQTADASFPGVVSTGAQTFAGNKTFNNSVTVSGGATVSGPAAGSGTAVTINTGNATNAGLVINGAASQTGSFIAVAGNGAGYSSFVVDSLGRTSLRPLSSTGDAFKIMDDTGATALLGVDTTSGLTTLQGLNVVNAATVGTLTFQGTSYSNFTTPQGSTVTAKLTVPLFNPGPSNQVVTLGLPNGASTSSRGISLFDNRAAGNNQPVLSVFTPNESDVFGLSSDGSNSYGYLKSTSGIGLGLKVGTNVVAQFDTSNNTTLLGNLTLQGGSATLGTSSQAGSLLLSDGSSNTATINVGALAGNYSVSIPTITANDTFCLQSNNCGYVASSLTDNVANALDIQEGTNNYINVNTTNGSENISFGNATTNPSYNFLGTGTLTVAGTLSPTSGVLFPGDNFLQTKSSNTLNDTTGILIPLYIYPGFVYTNSDYNNIIALKKKYHDVPVTVILNPATGPGSSVDTNYQDAILRLKGAGIKILGYVNTNSAAISSATVKTDIDGWKTLYPNIDGIFVDLMTYDANSSHYTYYSDITAYAHSKGFYPVVGNPGTAAPQGYFDNPTADIITVYENSTYPSEATLQGDWAGGNSDYNTNRRAVMVYNQASFDYDTMNMMRKYAGYVYVTSGSGGNPWGTIPSYLENMFKAFSVDQSLIVDTANVQTSLAVGTLATPTATLQVVGSAPVFGSELITNGTFTGGTTGWTLGDCAAYGTNNVVSTYTSCSDSSVSTSFASVAGTKYRLTFTLSSVANDQPYWRVSSNSFTDRVPLSNGTHTFNFTADYTGTDTLNFDLSSYNNGGTYTLDNVSLKAVTSQPALAVKDGEGDTWLSIGDPASNNIGLGKAALSSVAGGGNNVAIGNYSLQANTTGSNNTANGAYALSSNTIGSYNVANGSYALYSNVDGSYNAALGSNALFSNTSGQYNNAFGNNALYSNTTGDANVALGSYTLASNTTGSDNVAIGKSALVSNTTAVRNTAVGSNALSSNTTGIDNAGVGAYTLYRNTVGNGNAALGGYALGNSSTGDNNSAVGNAALYNNTSGTNNAALGASSLYYNRAGSNNTSLGYNSFSNYVEDVANTKTITAINCGTGEFTVPSHGYTVGEYVTFHIYSSGTMPAPYASGATLTVYVKDANTFSQIYCTSTGIGTITLVPSKQFNNSTAVGANTQVTASNQVVLGSSSVTQVLTAGGLYQSNGSNDNHLEGNLNVGTSTNDAQLVVQNTASGENALHIIATQDQDTGAQVGSITDLVVNPNSDSGSASFIGNEVYSNIYPGASIANDAVTNFNSSGVYQSSGDLNLLVGYASSFGYYCSPSCGTVGGVFGYISEDPLSGGGAMPSITNNVGVSVEDRTRGTNQTNLLIGASGADYSVVPSGSYSIYNASTKDNVFAGNLRVGSTAAPTVALDVAGAATVAGNLTVTNTGNVAFQKGSDYVTSSTPQNNVSFGTGVLFRLNPSNAITITGIAGGADGRIITLANVSAYTITFNDNDSGSTATNRIITGTGGSASLLAGGSITLIYDSGSGFWRITGAPASTSSSAVTLQTAYNNSTSPEITVNGTNGALTVRDNASAIGANLFEVQNNAGTTSYLAVAAAGVSVNNTPFTVSNGASSFTSNATTGIGQTITSTGLTTGLALRVDATSTPTTGGASGGAELRLTNAATSSATTYTGWNLKFTNNPTVAGNTEYAAQIQNQAINNTTDNVVDALLRLDNADTSSTGSTTISSALLIQNSGGIANGIATAININTADVVTDLSLQNGETIDNNTDGTIKLTSSVAQIATANASGTPSTNGTLGLRVDTASFTDNATAASGTAANFSANSFAAPTLAATNSSVTTTNAATLYIQGAPIKGTNNTAASTSGLYVAAGTVGAQTASYGAIINAQSGATNNYAAAFLGGNVGIGTSAPTADLSFGNGAGRTINVVDQTSTNTGNNLTVQAGRGGSTGTGGQLNLNGGQGGNTNSSGGAVQIQGGAGNATTTGGAGGAVQIQGGSAAGSNANNGGAITVTGGTPSATGAGGDITLTSGAGGSTSGASGAVSIKTGTTTSGGTGTITIQTGNATGGAAGNITIDTGTTGSGTPTVNVGSTNAKAVQIGNSSSNPGITIDSGTGAISIGTGAQNRTTNIATGGAVQTVTLGSTNTTSATTIAAGSGAITFNASTAQFSEVTGTRTLNVQARSSNVAGSNLTVAAGAAGTGASAFSGGILTLQGGAAAGTGNANGGALVLAGGAGVGSGSVGNIILGSGDATSTLSALTVRGAAGSGTNVAGGNITFDASNGTGSGGSGAFIFRTAPTTGAVVTKDNSASMDIASNTQLPNPSGSPSTWPYATANQSNRIMIVSIATQRTTSPASTVSSVTYNGSALTKLTSQVGPSSNGYVNNEIWYMITPPAGTFNIQITVSSTSSISAGVATYYNVDTSNPFPVFTSNQGSTSNPSITLSGTTPSELVLNTLANETSTTNIGTGMTTLWNQSLQAAGSYGETVTGKYGSTTASWSSVAQNWAQIVLAINSAGGSSADTLTEAMRISPNGNIGLQGSTATTYNLSFGAIAGATTARTIGVEQQPTSATGGNGLTVSAGAGSSLGAAASGGTLTLQGGAASGVSGNANGGGVTITGGAGYGTGVLGLVSLAPTYFVSSGATQSFSGSGSLTGVDSYSTIVASSSGTGVVITVPAPASGNQTIGRVLYIAAASGSNDFTLSLTGTSVTISMKANSTATLIWNGTGWTAAGASSSTDLQAAYNNTLSSAGGAEIVLNNSTSSNGLTIRNNATSPLLGGGTNGGALLETQTSIGSNLFSVNNNATEYATNGGAETAGTSSTAFPASSPTWKTAPNGGTTATISRETSIIATGQASTKVVTNGTTANQGADNELSVSASGTTTATALTANLQYTVSFAVKGATNFSTLDVVYSKDGTNTSTTSCSTGNTVEQSVWSRITCTFTAPSSGITSSNAIFVRQSDTTSRTWYIDNLSVTVNASVNHAADGSADVSGSMGATNTFNWVAVGGTVAQSTSTIYDTSGSVAVTTSSTNQGVYNNLLNSITPTVSTSYRASFYLKANSGTVTINSTTPSIYYSRDGGTTKASCNDLSATSITTTASWTLISCIFTTDSTPAGTLATNGPRFYITNTSNTTFFVDALTITLNQNTANNVQIGGSNNGGPVTLFTLDRSAGAPIAANNDAYLGSMYYDTSSSSIQCYGASGWGACGAAPDNIVNLTPEFPGAVLNGTGVGTMTADFCANQAGVLTVNSSLCDGTGTPAVVGGNFYKWTSPQASQQTYSIYVSYQLPTTFKSFSSDNTVQLTARVDDTTNAAVTYQMYDSHSGTLAQCGTGETTVTSSNNTWQTVGINGNEATGCSLSTSNAGDTIIFKINVKAANNKNAYVAGLSFTTKGK